MTLTADHPCSRARRSALGALLVAALAALGPFADAQDDPCAASRWDLARERALYATAPQAVIAGQAARGAPQLAVGRLYELRLTPGEQVQMTLPPADRSPHAGSFAGTALLQLSQAASYRISLDQPAWVDVVSGDRLIATTGYQGLPGCSAPRKSVEFALPSGQMLVLQFSSAPSARLRVTITPAG